MKTRAQLEKLFRDFTRLSFTLCDLYQDVTYLSYAEDRDIKRDKADVLSDVDEIQKQVYDLCQSATRNDLQLDPQGVNDAINNIRNELGKMNSLADIQNYVRYHQDRLHENDLIDSLAYKLLMEISHLYSQLCEIITDQAVYPYKTQLFLATYDDVKLNPQSAIQQSFIFFEDYLRYKIGVDASSYGEDLINKAFGRDGVLVYSDIPAEQNGVRNLFSGFYATFRNPHMHRWIPVEENQTIAIISTLYLLLGIVDNSKKR
ncbi:MAG: hypothetical protein IPP66_05350 [Anaerolineales bacterium]|nr:hypothetical protein [Anaerolineales bacterium]